MKVILVLVLACGLSFPSTDVSAKKKNPAVGFAADFESSLAKVFNFIPNTLSKVKSLILSNAELAAQILALDKVFEGGSRAVGLLDLSVLRPILETGLGKGGGGGPGMCSACQVAVGFLMFKIRIFNADVDNVSKSAEFICTHFNIGTKEVCGGTVRRMVPTIHFVVTETPELRADSFCGVFLQSFGCGRGTERRMDWHLELPQPRPRFMTPKDSQETKKKVADGHAKALKVVQLSDIHLDPDYSPGAPAVCENRVLCCSWPREPEQTRWHGAVKRGEEAGFWGDGRACDVPPHTLEMTLDHIVKQHPDMRLLYITGDFVPHNVYETTAKWNAGVMQQVADTMRARISEVVNVTVVVALGNHEPHPVNFYSPYDVPRSLDTTWIYAAAHDAFRSSIPADQVRQFRAHGSYAVQVSSTLRVLALNTNVCYEFNVWLMYLPRDPGGQLRWLIDELQLAEDEGQLVHIIGHTPPGGSDCFHVWSRNYYEIVRRYRRTIAGQFYGHSHNDEFKLVYSRSGRPLSVEWIAPSLTAYAQGTNLAYRVYHTSPKNHEILDHDTWTFDLRGANREWRSGLTGAPVQSFWELAYRFSAEYGLPNASPEAVHSLTRALARDEDLFEVYQGHFFKALEEDLDHNDRVPRCDDKCRKARLCDAVSYYSPQQQGDETEECSRLRKMVDDN